MKISLIFTVAMINAGLLTAQDSSPSQKEFLSEIQGATAVLLFSKGKANVDWQMGVDDLKKGWPQNLPKFDPTDVHLDWSKDPSFGEPSKILVIYYLTDPRYGVTLATSQHKICEDKLALGETTEKVAIEGFYLSWRWLEKQIFPNHKRTERVK